MEIEVDEAQILKQFKRNSFLLDKNCLAHVLEYLAWSGQKQKALKILITKLSDISVKSNDKFGESMVRIAIQIIKHGGQSKFNTFEDIIQDARKWSTIYISPYEHPFDESQHFFAQKPDPILFRFDADSVMRSDIDRFRRIQKNAIEVFKDNDWIIGMLYEDYSNMSRYNDNSKCKFILQTETTQQQIIFNSSFVHHYPLISGCVYGVKGKYLNRHPVLTVEQLTLPPCLTEDKKTFAKLKFKKMCENINNSKNHLAFQAKDFYKYWTIFNDKKDQNKMTLVFGSIKIQKPSVQRILRIISQFPSNSIECVILMLDEGQHDEIDLKIWLKGFSVFIVPNVNNEGPKLLPKIPILKKNFNATKILTNPAKFSIYGRESLFLNAPVMKCLHQKNLLNTKFQKQDKSQKETVCSLSEFLFSQSSVQICGKAYPQQSKYLQLRDQTLLFVSDKGSPQLQHSKDGKKQFFVSVGNFSRDGEFVVYMPKSKKPIQLCGENIN